MTDSSDEFEWDDASQNDAVIQRAIDEVCVYENPFGDIAIRKRAAWDEERDTFIVIAKGNVPTFIVKMQEVAGLFSARELEMMRARPDIDWAAVIEDFAAGVETFHHGGAVGEPKAKDPTAAERMKRYRKRRKERENEEGPDRNAVTEPDDDRNELRLVG